MIEQGSTEWLALRCGKVTASRVSDVIAKTKSGWGASRGNYMGELIAERLTGVPAERFTNAAMAWGTETEAKACSAYQFYHGGNVQLASFYGHPTIAMAGASPDRLVGDDGLIECKCPLTANHIEILLGQSVPSKYNWQMQFQLACTGRQWCDFVSYDPRLPESMSLFVQRVPRDGEAIEYLEKEIKVFLSELEEKLAALVERYGERKEAA
jgi:putative phage-type endonuclease